MKKTGILITVLTALMVIACVFVSCSPKDNGNNSDGAVVIENVTIGESTAGSGGDATVDKEQKTIVINVNYSTAAMAASGISLGDGINFKLYLDEAMTEEASEDLVLTVGKNTFYIKAWGTDENKSVNYKFTVVRKTEAESVDPINPGDGKFVVPAKKEVKPSDITIDEFKSVIIPILTEFATACGDDAEEIMGEIFDEEACDMITAILRTGGVTVEQLNTIVEKSGEHGDNIIKIAADILANEEFDFRAFYDKNFLLDAMAVAKVVLDNMQPEQAQEFIAPMLRYISEISYSFSYSVKDGSSFSRRDRRELTDAELKELYGGNLEEMFKKALGSEKTEDRIIKAVQADETYYTASALINAVKSVCDTDAEKLSAAVDAIMKIAMSEDIGEVLAGQGGLSYKEIVAAVNTVGELMNTFLNGLGDFEKFENAAAVSVVDLVRACGEKIYETPSVKGVCDALSFVADVMENITTATVTDLYLDFDDYQKASADRKPEKLGYFAAKACEIIKDGYAKLGADSKNCLEDIFSSFDITFDMDKFDEAITKATAKSAEKFTAEELSEIGENVAEIISAFKPQEKLYVIGGTPFVKVGANKDALIAEIDKICYGIYPDSNHNYNSRISASDCAVTYDNSKEGYFDVILEYQGKSATIKCYAYNSSSVNKFKYCGIEWYFGIGALTFAKGTATETDIKELFADTRNETRHFIDEYGNEISIRLDYNWDNAVIYGFNPNDIGERGGIIKVNYGDFAELYIPFGYNVYDADNPKVTSVDFDNDYYIIKGTDLSVGAAVVYDYCNRSEKVTLSSANIKGYDKQKLGRQEITVSYSVGGKTYDKKIIIRVISLEEARKIESVNTYGNPYISDNYDYRSMDELNIGDDIEELRISGNIRLSIAYVYFSDMNDLKTEMAKYQYTVKHDIDTSAIYENADYRIWLEDENGNEVAEIISGKYSVSQKSYETVGDIYNAVNNGEIDSFYLLGSAEWIAYDGNILRIYAEGENNTIALQVWIFNEDEIFYVIEKDEEISGVGKNDYQNAEEIAFEILNETLYANMQESLQVVSNLGINAYTWSASDGMQYGIILNSETYNNLLATSYPIPEEYANYKEIAEDGARW